MKVWINDFYKYLNGSSFTLYPLGIKEGPRIYVAWIFYSPWHICNGSKKRRYWGFQIEHKHKRENINWTHCFIVRYCCSNNTITLYILIFHWFFDLIFINLPPPPRKKRPTGHRPLHDIYSFSSLLFLKAQVIPTTVYWNLVLHSIDLSTLIIFVRSVRHTCPVALNPKVTKMR